MGLSNHACFAAFQERDESADTHFLGEFALIEPERAATFPDDSADVSWCA